MRGRGLLVVVIAVAVGAVASPQATAQSPDCDGPAPAAAPGTAAYQQRENDNVYCGGQRSQDTASNPASIAAYAASQARGTADPQQDPFRDPAALAGSRFHYDRIGFSNNAGQRLDGAIFRPVGRSGPNPGVMIVHGGGAAQQMYHWAAQGLAEAGYTVMTFQIPGEDNTGGSTHYENARAALDWFLSTPSARTAAGEFNPLWGHVDKRRVGLAGHSAGGVAVNRLGQEDARVSAVVAWDRAQSSTIPAGLRLRTPALYLVADFNCQAVPLCLPVRYDSPPDPRGPGNKDEDFRRLRAAGVQTMKVALRAATHLDFTELGQGTGSRYGSAVSFHYTRAWFDRYLRGAGLSRLVAGRFDASGDAHNISAGRYDATTGRNVPARIAGQRVVDRLSFHFRSAYYFGSGAECEDVRAGCPAIRTPAPATSCLARRSPLTASGIGRVRLGATRRGLAARAPTPTRRTKRSWRWCVKGGKGAVTAVFTRGGRVALVASTAPGHGSRGVRPGTRSRRIQSAYRRRRALGGGLVRTGPRSRGVIVVRRGRVRAVAVVTRSLAARERGLRSTLGAAGLR